MRRLERLTYVHDGDPGAVGTLIQENRGLIRFGNDGSGVLDLNEVASQQHPPRMMEVREVRIVMMTRSQLPPGDDDNPIEDVPCILGHSGPEVLTLVNARSIARMTGGVNDLRGKIKFGLAKVGWSL